MATLVPTQEEIDYAVRRWVSLGTGIPGNRIIRQVAGEGGGSVIGPTVGLDGKRVGSDIDSKEPYITVLNMPKHIEGIPRSSKNIPCRQMFGLQFYGRDSYSSAVTLEAWARTPEGTWQANKLGLSINRCEDVIRIDEEVGKTIEQRANFDIEFGYMQDVGNVVEYPDATYRISTDIRLEGGGGTGATAIAILAVGGSGYTSAPPVTVAAPLSGTIAKAESVLYNGKVVAINVLDGGSGYTENPVVTIDGAATAVSYIGFDKHTFVESEDDYTEFGKVEEIVLTGSIERINVTNKGTGYETPPVVVIDAVRGAGAVAYARVENGEVQNVTVVLSGEGYEDNLSVSINP